MSLLTDALRLREGRRPAKGGTRPSLPPFRGPNRGYFIGSILVLVFSIVVGLACWKGTWAVEKLEELAGFTPILPAKVVKESNGLDLVKETVPAPVVAEAVKMEGTKGLDETEEPIVAKIPAKGENLLQSLSLNPPLVPLGEEKKKEEIGRAHV